VENTNPKACQAKITGYDVFALDNTNFVNTNFVCFELVDKNTLKKGALTVDEAITCALLVEEPTLVWVQVSIKDQPLCSPWRQAHLAR
jgi:hypothetical protein